MSDRSETAQESFWAGDFGAEYIARNQSADLLAANIAFFSRALQRVHTPKDCLEFGPNVGMNLRALKILFPEQRQFGVEINAQAAAELRKVVPPENVFEMSILDFTPPQTFDLVLVKGTLIHINPQHLPQVYDLLNRSTGKHLLVCEYYNPTPTHVPYRGHNDRLFKRDFCGEILDLYPALNLIDYGFIYHRDNNFQQDDITWFLMEKR